MARPTLKDYPFPEEFDWEKIRGWYHRRLRGRPVPEIRLLTARVALRSLPFVNRALSLQSAFVKNPAQDNLLPCLRCHAVLVGASLVRQDEMGSFRRSLNTFAAAGDDAAASSVAARAGDSGDMIALSVAKAAAAAKAVAFVLSKTGAVLAASRVAAFSTFSFALSDLFATFAAAFERDGRILETSGLTALARAPLWPRFEADIGADFTKTDFEFTILGGAPPKIEQEWHGFYLQLNQLLGGFGIWVEWYEGILKGEQNGRYLFGLPTKRALRLNVDFALIDEVLWKGDPAALHAEMRRLVEQAKGEVGEAKKGEPPKRQTPPGKGKNATPPKTPVGQAMVANAAQIALQTTLLIPLIEQEIERVKAERPNSEEAIADRDARLRQLEKLKQNAIEIQKAPVELANAKITEQEAIKKVNAFFKPFRDCWNMDGEAFVRAGIGSGIFLGAVGIAHTLGMTLHPLITTTVLGAIAAEKPLVNVLKSAKGMFKFGGS